jgi:hypothetical protein
MQTLAVHVKKLIGLRNSFSTSLLSLRINERPDIVLVQFYDGSSSPFYFTHTTRKRGRIDSWAHSGLVESEAARLTILNT